MITILGFGLILVASCHGRSDEDIRGWFFSLAVACNKDYSISTEELAMLQDHNIPSSDGAKCLMACIYRKADLVDSKGNYDLEKTNKWLATEFGEDEARLAKAKQVFGLCSKVNDEPVGDGDKGCDRAFLLSKCLTENSPKA